MTVTSELLIELGFHEINNYWVDGHGHIFYKDRIPPTLGELVKIMTGVAFRKGEDKARRMQSVKEEALLRDCGALSRSSALLNGSITSDHFSNMSYQ